MFTHVRTTPSSQNGHSNGNAKPHSTTPRFDQYPALLIKSVRVVSRHVFFERPFSESFVFLVLDGMCSVRSAIMDGNTLVVGFEFPPVEYLEPPCIIYDSPYVIICCCEIWVI